EIAGVVGYRCTVSTRLVIWWIGARCCVGAVMKIKYKTAAKFRCVVKNPVLKPRIKILTERRLIQTTNVAHIANLIAKKIHVSANKFQRCINKAQTNTTKTS